MEKNHYQIVAKTPEDWKVVHKLLMQDGTLEDNIPERSVECANDIKHSKTRSTYLMTDDEAELLRKNDRVLNVSLDVNYHPEYYIPPELAIKKHGRSVRNYRSLKKYNTSTNSIQSYPPTTRFDGRISDEFYRTGYQILRCTQDENPFSSNSAEVKYQDIDYETDGTDVDLIVVDDGMFFGHPEFCSNEYDPPNYVRGNVLSRHGICGLLDLVLDSPYYMDPDWFDADPTARLERRWDGTIVPKEYAAKDWWFNSNYRSPSFPNFGSIYVKSEYTRESQCGKDQKTPPSSRSSGGHGTPCGSLVYGKNYGWAFNSNKWSIGGYIGENVEGMFLESVYDIIKIFHTYKPTNPKFGTKNPTISSNSYGYVAKIPGSGVYSYRNSASQNYSSITSAPNFLKTAYNPLSPEFNTFFDENDTLVAAGREMVDSGAIFVVAAMNMGRYLGTPSDEDFNNYIIQTGSTTKLWLNRPGTPAQIGYTNGSTDRYKTFIIGAIDDEYTGRYSSPSETNTTYLAEPSGKETLARLGTNSVSRGADYSNKGSAIDFYAPADGTLAASSSVTAGDFPNPYQKFSDITYYDDPFAGTSAACPVAAGLIGCFVQNNRNMSPVEIKTYLRNQIPSQNSSKFFIGPRPGDSPNDPAWLVPYSTMGRAVKIIKEVTSRIGTPNPSFTPTYGINGSSGANERFVITQNSGLTHNIEILGIKKFDETPTSYELNVKTGYYKVGSRSQVSDNSLKKINLRIDPSNSKKLQLTDSDGVDSWDDMEIVVTNGEFVKSSTEIYYVFRGGTLASSTAYSVSSISSPSYSPTGGPGSITGGGDLIVTGDITAGDDIIGLVSDERLKENIKPIENALDKLEKLDGFTYNFNEIGERLGFDSNKRHSGVSAQIVKDVLPEASAPAPADNDYLTVKYDKLIPLLIESIKDLKDDIDDIKKNDGK